ncbi:MAG: hypothetical protein ABI968_03375 [Acidobacteriota bacterium]
MPKLGSTFASVLAPLAGSAILVGCALASLPWRDGVLRRPRTPFDRSAARAVAPGYALLRDAAAVIPAGAALVALTEPRDPIQETYYYRFAVTLLPQRRVLPAAQYGAFVDPGTWKDAGFWILVGGKPVEPPGELLLETPEGSVWRRAPR